MQPIALPAGYYLETCTAEYLYKGKSVAYSIATFNLDHFCSQAADGSPFCSHHTLNPPEGLWIGHIFRDFPDEPWSIALRGSIETRGAWDDFQEAIAHLLEWQKEQEAIDLEWRRSVGLL